ncbi:MAG TPA: M23 family metallopeptidase, partial [candidate division Zixibacteria bacterium]|nr:M23 family metallopeptidase [candidate division Zixibacteria bacterium]
PLQGYVSQEFQDSTSGKYHPGVDFAVAIGTPVLSTASGEVTFAGDDPVYGKMVIVQHNDTVSTLYGHNSELLVAPGDAVIAGGRLALSGNSGQSSAPHLHYEIRINGVAIDPGLFLGGVD